MNKKINDNKLEKDLHTAWLENQDSIRNESVLSSVTQALVNSQQWTINDTQEIVRAWELIDTYLLKHPQHEEYIMANINSLKDPLVLKLINTLSWTIEDPLTKIIDFINKLNDNWRQILTTHFDWFVTNGWEFLRNMLKDDFGSYNLSCFLNVTTDDLVSKSISEIYWKGSSKNKGNSNYRSLLCHLIDKSGNLWGEQLLLFLHICNNLAGTNELNKLGRVFEYNYETRAMYNLTKGLQYFIDVYLADTTPEDKTKLYDQFFTIWDKYLFNTYSYEIHKINPLQYTLTFGLIMELPEFDTCSSYIKEFIQRKWAWLEQVKKLGWNDLKNESSNTKRTEWYTKLISFIVYGNNNYPSLNPFEYHNTIIQQYDPEDIYQYRTLEIQNKIEDFTTRPEAMQYLVERVSIKNLATYIMEHQSLEWNINLLIQKINSSDQSSQ